MFEYRYINNWGDVVPVTSQTRIADIPDGFWKQERYVPSWEDAGKPIVRVRDGRRTAVNGLPFGTIDWSEHQAAWEVYGQKHKGQDAETIAERGGFGWEELIMYLGHKPQSWKKDARTPSEQRLNIWRNGQG